MKNAYKVKLKNGKILESLSKDELEALYHRGEVTHDDFCLCGEETKWRPLSKVIDLPEKLEEFQFDASKDIIDIDYKKIREDYLKGEDDEKLEKTQVRKQARNLDDLEKTIVLQKDEKIEDGLSEEDEETKADDSSEEEEEEKVSAEGETALINVDDILENITEEAESSEEEIRAIEEEEEKKAFETTKKQETEEPEIQITKKKIKPIVLLAMIVLFYFLLIEEEEPVKEVRPQKISFTLPYQNEYEDQNLSRESFIKGVKLYKKGDYLSKARAVEQFKKSVQNKFEDNPALGLLILSYAELLPNAKNLKEAKITLGKLLRMSESKIFKDINITLGKALYFLNADRPFTAVRTIEKYMMATKKTTKKLYSVYLFSLSKSGNFEKAGKIYETLQNNSDGLPIIAYLAMADHQKRNQNYEESGEIIKSGLALYPDSVALLLEEADHALRLADIKKQEEALEKVKLLNYESSPQYYSRYLEHLGVLSALKGKTKEAANLFLKALKEHESLELRSKLATLGMGGGEQAKKLILESKIIDNMRKAREFREAYKWEEAFRYAIEAVDMSDKYIPSLLLLADIQMDRGYFNSAIKTLLKLKQSYANNVVIVTKLIEAYIETYRLNDALLEINSISSEEEVVESPEYAFVLGKYFEQKKLYKLAISWYKKSIEKNPLDDLSYYALAHIHKAGNNLKTASRYLVEAINLNPEESKYKILYSRILEEQDGHTVSVGYLREELEDSKNQTIILGEIAANYYKNGQLKYFDETYKKIKELNLKDESFYRFLANYSLLNDNKEKAIEYLSEFVKMKPGDMAARIELAQAYLEKKDFFNATEHLMKIKEAMSNYPNVNYYLAKVYYLQDELEKSMAFSEEEITKTPNSPLGYLIKAKILFKKKEHNSAVKLYEKSLYYDHRGIEALVDLAKIRALQNRFEQAMELLLRAERIEKNLPDIHRELGFIYKNIGQNTLALESFKTYLSLAPGSSDSSEIKRIMQSMN